MDFDEEIHRRFDHEEVGVSAEHRISLLMVKKGMGVPSAIWINAGDSGEGDEDNESVQVSRVCCQVKTM